jgi:MFS transporter, OPA family, glycerol-3-phosphate transporter
MGFFTRLFKVFTPPPPVTQLPLEVIDKEYKKHRKLVFAGIFAGYGAAYLIRKNFSLAMPYLVQQGFSKGQLGLALTALAIAYGFSKFLMGNVSDRSNPKYFLAAGLIVSTLVAFTFGFADWAYSSVAMMFVLMFINGWAQGMCYGPCSRVLAHWYSVKERGIVMSVWNIAHNLGGGLIGILAILGMWLFGDWHSLFYFPAMIVALFTIMVLITVRDTPQSVGLPSIEDYHSKSYMKKHETELKEKAVEEELTAKDIFFKHVFNNKAIWILSIANIFVYFVRYGVLDWAPTYLSEVKGFDYKGQGWAYFLYEYAGIPSIILCGYISDKFFRNKRTPVIVICMALVTFAVLLYWLNPPGHYIIDNIALVAVGFLIYGPVVLIGMQALDVVYKKAAGTATGLTGFFGYMGGTVCANALMGYVVQYFGWDAGFIMLLVACVLSVVCLIPIWNVGGEDHKVHPHKKHEILDIPPQTQ